MNIKQILTFMLLFTITSMTLAIRKDTKTKANTPAKTTQIKKTITKASLISQKHKTKFKAPKGQQEAIYHFNFKLKIDPTLLEETQSKLVPRLVFSFLGENGQLASERFGEFTYVSPGDLGYRVSTASRGPYYINYIDANVAKSLFPIQLTNILAEEQAKGTPLHLKGFGPFNIRPDEFEATFTIYLEALPNQAESNAVGIYSHKNLRIVLEGNSSDGDSQEITADISSGASAPEPTLQLPTAAPAA